MKQVEKLAAGQDLTPNEWCRQVVLEKLAERRRTQAAPAQPTTPSQPAAAAPSQTPSPIMTRADLILFEELIRLRWMFQISLRYFGKDGMTPDGWNYLNEQANNLNGHSRAMAEEWLVKYGVKKPAPKS